MPKIKFYHVRTLLWTYLVWAVLCLLFTLQVCKLTHSPLTRAPWAWAVLHIAPLWGLTMTMSISPWWGIPVAIGIAWLAVVSGLLINRWWARFLILIGMSIWFFVGMCLLGLGV
jgi:hypothetical protein